MLLVIVSTKADIPIYELEFANQKKESTSNLGQFIVHSALDTIDEVFWTNQGMYLKSVDKFNDMLISAFVTMARVKFVLLHEPRNEDSVKGFFNDLFELFMKIQMNPFFDPSAPLTSAAFDQRVKQICRRYF